MPSEAIFRLLSITARLAGFAGATLTTAGLAAWAAWMFSYFENPTANVGLLPVIFVVQNLIALLVLLSIFLRPLFSSLVLAIAFVGSFLGSFGWYLLLLLDNTPLGLVGVGNLLYLVALVLMAAPAFRDSQRFGGIPTEAIVREVRSGPKTLGAILLLVVAAIMGYVTLPTTPPEVPALGPPNTPPLSCPDYLEEEIAAFDGTGNHWVTPSFEITGDQWGYQVNSVGFGSLNITVLDEDGNAVAGADELGVPGGSPGSSTGMAEFAFGGTFALEIDADEDMSYEILLCEEANPSGRNKSG